MTTRRGSADALYLDAAASAAAALPPRMPTDRRAVDDSSSSSRRLSPERPNGRRGSGAPTIRSRSYSNVSGATALAPAAGDSNPASPDQDPMSPASAPDAREAHPPGGANGHASDAYVHLRRLHLGRPSKYGERSRGGGAAGGVFTRWSRYLRSSLERRIASVVLSGMLLGALLHLIVSFESIAAAASHGAGYLPVPSSAALHGSYDSAKRRMAAGPVVQPTKPGHAADPTTLGMPGDSDRLPNTPVWDAAAYRGPARIAPDDPDWPNTLALCAIMKNEHPDDVVQWVKYHKWLGVDQIFLKENAPAVPPLLTTRLQPYIDSGFLQLGSLPGPKHPLQNRWYNRCSKPDMAGSASWVAFIDLDEFVVVLDEGVAAKSPDLKGTLAGFRGNAGLSLQWVLFGSSGHVKRPSPGGPLAHFHKCTGKFSYQMKCMANMYHAADHMMVGNTVHDCTYRLEDGDVSEPPVTTADGTRLRLFQNTDMTNPSNLPALGESRTYLGHLNSTTYDPTITRQHKLALFHYVTRSLEDYTTRKVKLPSGIYTHNYVRFGAKTHVDIADKDVMAKYERANGFDGTAPICSSVPKSFYVGQCCSGPA